MRFNIQIYIQITAWSAFNPCFAFSGYPQAGTVVNTCRDLDFKFLILFNSALSATFLTWFADYLAFTMTFRTWPYIGHLSEHSVLSKTDLATSVTFRASFNFRTRFRTIPMTMRTLFVTI